MKNFGITLLSATISIFFWLMSILLSIQLLTSETKVFIWQNYLTLGFLLLASGIVSYLAYRSIRIWQNLSDNVFQKAVLIYFQQVTKGSFAIFLLSLGILPMFYRWADISDAPGVMILGLAICLLMLSVVFICLSFTKLYQKAVHLQKELAMVI